MQRAGIVSIVIWTLAGLACEGDPASTDPTGDVALAKRTTAKKGSCAVDNGGCSPHAACTQVKRNHVSCACKPGFTGDGLVCTAPPSSCATAFDFESGSLAGWDFSQSDAGFGPPAISTATAHTGARSLAVPAADGQFRIIRDVCPGSTFDLTGKALSFWVWWNGFPATSPDNFSGCEPFVILPDGVHIGLGERQLWPVSGWTRVDAGRDWNTIKSLGIYCVVNTVNGAGTMYFDDIRIE